MASISYVPIIDRLAAEVPGLSFGGPTDYADAGAATAPAAWVVLLHERAQSHGPGQLVKVRFGVVIKIDPEPDVDTDTLEPLRTDIRDALAGWSPGSGLEPCIYLGGRLLEQDNTALYWRDLYETAFYFRSV